MLVISVAQQPERKKKSWRDKDIRDMTEADLEHLLDQWEVCLAAKIFKID